MLEIEYKKPNDLIPYVNNSRTHSESQITQVASSIKEFGFTNPILIDGENGIIAGHGRLLAALKLDISEVPTITLHGLTDAQRKAYVIADNQLALNSGWDLDILKIEMDRLSELDFNLDILGFDDEFLSYMDENSNLDNLGDENPYTMNIEAPTYEPSNEKPPMVMLTNLEKTSQLIEKIKKSSVSADEKTFLLLAAERHTVFDFSNIADYYAHSDEEMQSLMEDSALVIIDYEKALEGGFVQINKQMTEQYEEDSEIGDDNA